MSAEVPVLFTLTSLPQKEKKSCSLSSVVSGARPATWMVYPGAGAVDMVMGLVDVMGSWWMAIKR